MTLIASLIDGLPLSFFSSSFVDFDDDDDDDDDDDYDLAAKFSFHKNDANNPPASKNPVDNSKGPVGPRLVAAKLASWPAIIATIESPAYALRRKR
jgi:hypothetical protein